MTLKQKSIKFTALLLAVSLTFLLCGCDDVKIVRGTLETLSWFNRLLGLPEIPMQEAESGKTKTFEPLPEDSIFRYYGSLLEGEERDLYEQIRAAVAARAESMDVKVSDLDRLLELVGYVRTDNPEYFWFTDSTRATGYEKDGVYYITLLFAYNCTESEQIKHQAELDSVTGSLLNRLATADEYEKVKGIYEFIIHNTSYDTNYTDQSCYSVLVHRRGVCAGYTNAARYLLNKLGIKTIYVSGYGKGEEHCWCEVKVNGSWYALDVTWGDPVTEDNRDLITYTYFLTTDKDMKLDHTISPDNPPVPNCVHTGCNYYVWQGRYLDTKDTEQISIMMKDAASRKEMLEFKCSNQLVYEGVVKYLVEEEGLWRALNYAHYFSPWFDPYQATYSSDDVHHIIRITPDYE